MIIFHGDPTTPSQNLGVVTPTLGLMPVTSSMQGTLMRE